MMKEEILKFGKNFSLTGILTFNEEIKTEINFCVIFINSGLIHKIGPNRLYVNIAREIAKKGIDSFRFDYSGLGDSDLSNQDNSLDEIKLAMDLLQQKCNINKFVLIGICSGAEDAFYASFEDRRIEGLLLVEGKYLDTQMLNNILPVAIRNTSIRYYKKNIFSRKRWIKIFTGKSKALRWKNIVFMSMFFTLFFKRILNYKKVKSHTENSNKNNNPVSLSFSEWDSLLDRNVKIYLIFCEGGIAIDVYNLTISKKLKKEQETNDQLKVELIKDVDHTFTPIWSQKLLIEKISDWLEQI